MLVENQQLQEPKKSQDFGAKSDNHWAHTSAKDLAVKPAARTAGNISDLCVKLTLTH